MGVGVEVVSGASLERIASVARDAEDREHVTPYIRTHPELFRIHIVRAEDFGLDYPDLRLTVDTLDDLDLMKALQKNLGPLEELDTKDVVEFLGEHPEIRQVNAQIEQKMPGAAGPADVKASVIIRTHNSANCVRNAVDSALNQTLPKDLYEILVVDDGSTDSTREILGSYKNKIRVIEQENKGYVEAANKGVVNAKGEYLILLDADDTFEPELISEMLNAFHNERDVAFVYIQGMVTQEDGLVFHLIKPM